MQDWSHAISRFRGSKWEGLDLVAAARRLFPPHGTFRGLLQDALDGPLALLHNALGVAFDVQVDLALALGQLVPRGLVEALGGDGSTGLLVQVCQGVPVGHLHSQLFVRSFGKVR